MKSTTLRFSTLLLALAFFIASCHKDKDETPTPSVVGYWKGNWGGTTGTPTEPWSFLVRSNGTLRIYDGPDTAAASKAEGIYALTGQTLTVNYNYGSGGNDLKVQATLNEALTRIDGTWGISPSNTDGGLLYLDKQ